MKMNVKEISKIFIISLAIFIIAMSFMFVFTNTNKVFAEEITDNAVLNFNQLNQNGNFKSNTVWRIFNTSNYTLTINNSARVAVRTLNSDSNLYSCLIASTNTNVFTPNHKIFIHSVIDTNIVSNIRLDFHTGTNLGQTQIGKYEYDFIYTLPNVIDSNYFYGVVLNNQAVGSYYDLSNYFIVDLTQMFGSGNEPDTVEKVKSYLPLDYYDYTTSTLVNLGYQNGYNNGIKDYSDKAFTIDVVSSDFVNTAYFIDGNQTEFKKLDQYVTFNGRIALDVKYTLEANDTIIMDLETLSGTEFDIQYFYNGGYYTMQHIVADNLPNSNISAGGITYKNGTITIKLPVDINTIYFNGISWLNVYKVEYKTFNYDTALQASFDSGYKKGLSYGNGNMFSDGFSFLSTMFHGMGEILSIEFIPNVPIWALLMIPVLIGLIGLIYKLAGK